MKPAAFVRLFLGTIISLGTFAFAKDFTLKTLLQAKKPTFDMTVGEPISYYDYVHEYVGKKMLEESGNAKPISTNEPELKKGSGFSVKLSD